MNRCISYSLLCREGKKTLHFFFFIFCTSSEKLIFNHITYTKVPCELNKRKKTNCMMNFELLPDDIFLDLFDYFNGIDLFNVFYGLNSRFNRLLYQQYRTFRFNFHSISKQKFDMICQKYLPLISDHVISLCLSNDNDTPQQIELFYSYFPSIQQFRNLRSLSLSKFHELRVILTIINQCHDLYHLTHLKLVFSSYENNVIHYSSMIENIFNLPKLVHCQSDMSNFEKAYFYLPTKIFPSLKSLSFFSCKMKLMIYQNLYQILKILV